MVVKESKNRNALRSKRMLTQALSELILEMPYNKITVSAITRRADLNRGTFYAHYESVDDLMRELIDDIMEKLFSVLHAVSEGSFPKNPKPVLFQASSYLQEEFELYKLLVSGKESAIFLEDMKRRIRQNLIDQVRIKNCHKDEAEAHIAVVFLSSGLVDVYIAWLRGEYGNIAVERVNDTACELCKSALQKWA